MEKLFVDSFNDFGHTQCITELTHSKGKTLDLLLTNSPALVENLVVNKFGSLCNSDHFPVSLKVKSNLRFKKPPKRKIYNFKRANWDALNRDLRSVDWDAMLDRREPEVAWSLLKSTIFSLADIHIPKITLKNNFQSPWFDSEVYHAYLKKERAHASKNNSELDGIKFSSYRKQFKELASQKMRDNLYNSDDPAIITKKFWAHVKANSKSQRIPDTVHYKGRFRSSDVDKANLFNSYFHEQFSEESQYDIDIDWANDECFEIDFDHRKIRKLLSKVNSNKAQGPDGIHGKILKNCASSLAYPLSIMFKISYNSCCIPREWRHVQSTTHYDHPSAYTSRIM